MGGKSGRLVIAFVLAEAAIVAVAVWAWSVQKVHLRSQAEADLTVVARLKVEQIEGWRHERLGDAGVLMDSPFFQPAAARFLDAPGTEDPGPLLARFQTLKVYRGSDDVALTDPRGTIHLSSSGVRGEIHAVAIQALVEAFRRHAPVLTDLHGGPGDLPLHTDVVAPLFDGDGRPRGAVVLRSDASGFLLPMLQTWPTSSQTAESLLVRQDGDDVVFLSKLRHGEERSPLTLRIPKTQKDVPAVQAAAGYEGVVEGRDYRGVEVLAVARSVPGTRWFLVAKEDANEAFAARRYSSVLIITLTLALVSGLGAALGLLGQRKAKAHFRALFEAEAARLRSEQRYRTTLLSVGDGVIGTDPAGIVEFVNPVAERLTGWTQQEALGRPLLDVFRVLKEETREPGPNPVEQVVRDGAVRSMTNHTLLVARDGTEKPIAETSAPIRDASGRLVGVVLVFRDQTRERHAAREQERLRAQLFESQKMESVGRLAGGVAHDFNNLLSVIVGNADLALADTPEGSRTRGYLADIRHASDRASKLIRQLLTFSRKQVLRPEILNINLVVQGVERLLRSALGESIRLELQMAEELGYVTADPTQLEQVLMNLAVNARDAMPDGGTFRLRTERVQLDGSASSNPLPAAPGRYVMLTATDTGTGMDEETKSHVFEPFFTTKGPGKGTGLGMSTVYGTVTQTGGFIRVDSEPGHGTSIRIYLPSERTAPPPAVAVSSVTEDISGTETVLVVEDEAFVRQLVVKVLELSGYEVLQAGGGPEALRMCEARSKPIHLLLTDVIMADMNGKELATRVRQVFPEVVVVYMSGCAENVIAHYGVLEPGIRFISKPFRAQDLARLVRQALDERA